MTVLVDTHAHLDFPQFTGDLPAVLQRARKAGVEAIINVGTDLSSSQRSVELGRDHTLVGASAGIHPHNAARMDPGLPGALEKMVASETVLAVGETGLDFYRNLSPRDTQEDIFRQHIRLARRVDKPLIIHSRQAHEKTLQVLREERLPSRPGVMHCFSGGRRLAGAFLDLGFYISIAGPVTYPRSHDLRELLAYIPGNRLLFETDSPYLAPQAYRGGRNEPSYIRLIYERAALALNRELDLLADQVYVNAVRLFSSRLVDRD